MKYRATTMVAFGQGDILGLSDAQATARTAALAKVDGRDGWYVVTAPIQLKRGEQFAMDAEPSKANRDQLEVIDGADAPADGKGKAAVRKQG